MPMKKHTRGMKHASKTGQCRTLKGRNMQVLKNLMGVVHKSRIILTTAPDGFGGRIIKEAFFMGHRIV